MNKALIFMTLGFLLAVHAEAQRDTSKTQSIDITSSFRPILRNAIKINFSGSQLLADTSVPSMEYNIPSQNLFYAYQPISLRPLALLQDTNLYLGGRNYLKAGFGNYNSPILKTGITFGDGNSYLLNLSGSYSSSKGNDIKFQDYSLLNVRAASSFFTKKNEINAGASWALSDYFLYGYNHNAYTFTKSDLRQQFQDVSFSAGIRNSAVNSIGVNYHPNLKVQFFSSKDRLTETSILLEAPFEKKISDAVTVKLNGSGDFTNYATKGFIPNNIKFSNNVLQLMPAFSLTRSNLKLQAGFKPTWNNGDFVILPDISAELKIKEKIFSLQAGWVGHYNKNTYFNLSNLNPYLTTFTSQKNTREIEYYAGIKTSLGKHFSFNSKMSWISYTDLPLFINDTSADEKTFVVSNEPKAKNIRIHGDINYVNQNKLSLTAGINLNGYTGFKVNGKPWHTVPMEFTSSIRWHAFERFLLKGDVYLFNGGNYLTKGNSAMPLTGGTDLSAGAEYMINKQFSAWLNVNNLLNDKYERLHNYQVYGLNLSAGILINF